MDTLKERTAFLGKSTGDKDISKGMKVTIELTSRLPFIHMSQLAGTGDNEVVANTVAAIQYNKSFSNAEISIDPAVKLKNVLVDEDNPDRYTTIAVLGSLITQNECMLVHDVTFGDLLLIPTMNHLGDSPATEDMFSANELFIDGYQVGGTVGSFTDSMTQSLKENLGLAVPAVITDTKAHMFSIVGFRGMGGSVNNNGQMFGDKYIESRDGSVMQMTSLGSTDLFGEELTAAILANVSPTASALFPSRKSQLDDILIPILF